MMDFNSPRVRTWVMSKLWRISKDMPRNEAAYQSAVGYVWLRQFHPKPGQTPVTNPLATIRMKAESLLKDDLENVKSFVSLPAEMSGDLLLDNKDSADRDELTERVSSAIAKLPAELRGLVVGKWYRGLTISKLAKEGNVSRATINRRLFQSKKLLKTMLADLRVSHIEAEVASSLEGESETDNPCPLEGDSETDNPSPQ